MSSGKIYELVDFREKQGVVDVEDLVDLEPVSAVVGPEVGDAVGAVDLEPELRAPVLLRTRDDPERG